ncbi:MAG: molybdenum cofactor guanylyltransferase MobA [Rhodospirillales bacterium]|nr:molybdenum cofactor guanylyltransferase MobA [Rhodospirillales bacterium]
MTERTVLGVLLAGGLARRMGGGDKGLSVLGGRPMLDRIIERARPQVSTLILNANGDSERFAAYGLDVAPDVIEGFAGPLAGVLTGLEWAAENAPDIQWVATFATDAPFVPMDLVDRLDRAVAKDGADLACACSNGRAHPVFGLWPRRLAGDLRRAMIDEDMRRIDRWTARYKLTEVEFSADPFDPFFNVNAPENLAEAERLLSTEKRGAA